MQESILLNKRELLYLAGGLIVLLIANIVDLIWGRPFWIITRFIYLGSDENVSSWYSSILLFVAGLIAYECWLCAKRKDIQGGLSFLLFSGLLIFMSGDEVARFHEILGEDAANFLGISSKDFAKHSSWVWIGGPLVVAIFGGIIVFLKKVLLLASPKSIMFLAIGFFSIILGGVVLESTINFLNHEELQWVWDIEIILEEAFEMIGTIFIIYALMLWRDGVIKLFQQTS